MMRFYCPQCWNDFGEDHPFCPRCGYAIHAEWERKTWVEKVIHALDHPEPRTVLRATEILGRIQDVRAVDSLIRLAQNATDVFVLLGTVEALASFDLPEAHRQLLSMATRHPARMVRQAAKKALKKKSSDPF